MEIEYRKNKDFSEKELQELFLSVEWDSGNYPEKLKIALKNSRMVYAAYDDGKLVGLINSLSDGIMTVYFHYLLVKPEYQGQGIGKKLVDLMLAEYADFARKAIIAYDREVEFYKKCGFEVGEDKSPMFVTYLKT
ncbi:GNAT family N-acetyltransferase [Methanobacterium alcaliphilum]|uniref:GNAT family N-acetyltransferase n=1 Tax=Methanobacterium alcaliphilum TaxID=392018 RepID=UPI002009F099|nr:GNAT family N-acetyltransferase [Methanobacterium alcaliphilum]